MTIDEAIEQFKYDAECNRADLDISYAEENEQVAEFLEELKAYRTIGTVEELTALEKSDASKEKSSIEYYNQMREYHDKLAEYESIGTVEECRENKDFLEFLYNRINPNDMEQYLSMYNCSDEKIN